MTWSETNSPYNNAPSIVDDVPGPAPKLTDGERMIWAAMFAQSLLNGDGAAVAAVRAEGAVDSARAVATYLSLPAAVIRGDAR